MSRTLVVTNDFPPRQGGIQTFVAALLARRPPDSVVVLASHLGRRGRVRRDAALPGDAAPDRHAPADPRDVAGGGRAAPAARLRHRVLRRRRTAGPARAGAAGGRGPPARGRHARPRDRWVALPGARQLLQRIAGGLDVLTYISEYTRSRLRPCARPAGPGSPSSRPACRRRPFTPAADGAAVRRRYGLGDGPVVVCVSRLVARKGQDVLVGRLAAGAGPAPDGAVAAGGRRPRRARRCAGRPPPAGWPAVRRPHRAGGAGELPAHYAAGDVFAMPCRTRRGGLDVEGLGMVYLEAAACGLPVVAGTSGGAPEAVQDGVTGHVVDPRSPERWPTRSAPCWPTRPRARDGRGRPGVGGAAVVVDTIAGTFAGILEP